MSFSLYSFIQLGCGIHGDYTTMMVQDLQHLRSLYGTVSERALKKEIHHLDDHCRSFIAACPFVVMATSNTQGQMDSSPRGGPPGFMRVTADGRLLIPDATGNNRLDSLENIVEHGQVGLLLLVPGVKETLRINGSASLSLDPSLLALFADDNRPPKLLIEVRVQSAYLHCAKALMRSQLWAPEAQIARSALPTSATIIAAHTGLDVKPESQEDMEKRYQADL
jgi:uncharacterized protein